MEEKIREVFNDIKWLLKEAEKYSRNSACEYDEGWYNGKCDAYEIVLEKLKNILK